MKSSEHIIELITDGLIVHHFLSRMAVYLFSGNL